jgi:hypothetical protein
MYGGYFQSRPLVARQYSANVCYYRLDLLEKKIRDLDRTVHNLNRKVHRLNQLVDTNRNDLELS